jgi:hypothetical protein
MGCRRGPGYVRSPAVLAIRVWQLGVFDFSNAPLVAGQRGVEHLVLARVNHLDLDPRDDLLRLVHPTLRQ